MYISFKSHSSVSIMSFPVWPMEMDSDLKKKRAGVSESGILSHTAASLVMNLQLIAGTFTVAVEMQLC